MQRILAFLAVFVLSLHYSPFYYINSVFLSEFWNDDIVSLAFLISAGLSTLLLIIAPVLIRIIGTIRLINILVFVSIFSLLFRIFSVDKFVILGSFVIGSASIFLIYLCLDIILENASRNKTTGSIRGKYLTLMNLAIMLGPLIASQIIGDKDYYKVFLVSIVLIIPFIFIVNLGLKKTFNEPNYKKDNFPKSFSKVLKNNNLRNTFFCKTLLSVFYSWMTVFTPLFLIKNIGLSLDSITLIIGLALIPFIIFQGPAGKIADKKFGQKEILILGFIIMGLSCLTIPFIKSSLILVWGVILFLTRVGASLVEVMTETHFYKQISSQDSGIIGAYSVTNSIGYLIGPLLAFPMLIFFPGYTSFFFGMFSLSVLGIIFALRLKDTK